MKIDKRNPRHWWALACMGLNTLVAIFLRPWLPRRRRARVVFYGHKLNGNLMPIYRHLREMRAEEAEAIALTLDEAHFRELREAGESVVLATSPRCIWLLATADALVTSHGLHAMQPLVRWSSIKFFDVWHGIPFKGFDADDFRVQHRYDEIWVASELHRSLYIDRYGFDASKVRATGYARTDRLVTRHEDVAAIRRRIGAPVQGKLILFAPTWAQDAAGRNIFPFGTDEATFLGALSGVASREGATVLMRAHLNTCAAPGRGYPNVIPVSAAEFPDTEEVLLVADVLICDWSSIAFDFLLLDRPTLFLDVPSPFRKGFSLGPEYRFGPVLKELEELRTALRDALADQVRPLDELRNRRSCVRKEVYETFADGQAAKRCAERLLGLVKA